MLITLFSVTSLLVGVCFLMAAHGLFSTFLAVRMNLEGFATEVTGLVMSAYFVGLMLGARLCGGVVNRAGHIRAFAALAAAVSAAVLLAGIWISPILWALCRVVIGFCLAGLFMAAESWLNSYATGQTRGRILSLYMIVTYFGLTAGQLMLPLGAPETQTIFMIAALLFSLAVIPVALTRAKGPQPVETTALRLVHLFRISPLGITCVAVSGLATAALYGMGPVYAEGIGFSVSGISYFMGAAVAGGLLLQWPVGRLSDRHDRRRIITILAFLTSGVSLLLIAAESVPQPAVLVVMGLYGGLLFTLYPLAVAYTNDHVTPGEMLATSGGLVFAYSVGASLGPLAAAGFMGQIGPAGLFVFAAVVTLLLGLFALYRMTRRPAPPIADQAPFLPLPRMTPVSSDLDPRVGAATEEAAREAPTDDAPARRADAF